MIFEENCYYHLYNRGCSKENIFREKSDYEKLIKIISESKLSEYLKLCAFSFMPNHYHLLVKQTTSKSVTSWIQFIFNRYAKYVNKKYDRKGTVFESRVKAKLIDKLEYLRNVTHYIHSNPKADFLKKYCSIEYLHNDSIIDSDFYIEFFGSVENYLSTFMAYQNSPSNENIEEYLF